MSAAAAAGSAGDTSDRPAPKLVLDLLNGFRSSKVLFTLVKLGIPDLIAQQPQQQVSLAALAKLLAGSAACQAAGGTEPSHDGLGRLLDAAVGLGLLNGDRQGYWLADVTKAYLLSVRGTAADLDPVFACCAMAVVLGLLKGDRQGYWLADVTKAYLLSDVEGSLSGYVHHSDMLYKLWEELETAVLTGTNCWQSAFGLSSSDVFGSLYQNDAAVLRFMQGMDGFSQLSAWAVLTAFDLSGFRVLVDWGGATGALAAAACSIYPEIKGVVVDLPHVVEKAQEHFSQRPAAVAVAPRLSWVAGDFFGPPGLLPDGDLVVLGRILHDWEEARGMKLLHNIFEKLPVGGALLVAEMLLDEGGTSPPEVLLQSLNMLTQTHGRERRLSEYCHMLEAAGFRNIQGKKTGTYLDAVIAYKTEAHSPQPT